MCRFGAGMPTGESSEASGDDRQVDIVGIEWAALPPDETLALWVARFGHGVEELLEARDAADILGRGTASAVDEAGIVECGIGGGDRLDGDSALPVVAEVVGVLRRRRRRDRPNGASLAI